MTITEIHDTYCPDRGRLDHVRHRCDVFTGLCHAAREERERAAKIAEAEPELEGPMPDEVWALSQRITLEQNLRSAVQVTKRNIAAKIRAVEPSPKEERP